VKGDTTNGNITVNLTAAQLDALTTINSVATGNAFKIVVNDTAAVTVNLADTTFTTTFVDNISFAASTGGASVTVAGDLGTAAAAEALTLGSGNDTLTIITAALASAGGRLYNLGGGADTVNVNVADGIVTATDLNATASTTSILNVNANVTTAALDLGTNMDIFATVNFTVDQVSGGNAVNINNKATLVTAVGGDFILGTGGDTFKASGTASNVVTDGSGADTLTFSNTLGNTVYAVGGGIDTINLNASNGVADTIGFVDAASGNPVLTAASRNIVNGFNTAHDIITLDVTSTTAGAATTKNAIVVVDNNVATNFRSATDAADVLVVNFDVAGTTAVLANDLTGASLIANLGHAVTITAADTGYVIAYDNGNAYIYYMDGAAGAANNNTTLAGDDLVLIGVINGVAVGSIGTGNLVMI